MQLSGCISSCHITSLAFQTLQKHLAIAHCRYVSGDFRFRASYSKHNPRKMVKVWAEKERRNLVRLQAAGIRSPQPLQLRSHVLIMDFIGQDGVAAPRLKVFAYQLVLSGMFLGLHMGSAAPLTARFVSFAGQLLHLANPHCRMAEYVLC